MPLTVEQVLALAPDASSVAAGRKAANVRDWSGLGHDERAAWGNCQGSAVYGVMVDLTDHTAKCSCPSRKFPCKHALGLLLLHAAAQVPGAPAPESVTGWIGGRDSRAAKKTTATEVPFDAAAAAERETNRLETMRPGIATLRRFLEDLMREGLAGVEASPPWAAQAARLVDAKAPGLANRVRALEELVGASDRWPVALAEEIGLLGLLVFALERHNELSPPLAAEVRARAGVPVSQEAVLQTGERVHDVWWVVGQSEDDEDRVRARSTWLCGETSGRFALVLQFAPPGGSWATSWVVGSGFAGMVAFFPCGERALVVERTGDATALGALRGHSSVEGLRDEIAGLLAQRPWTTRRAAVLHNVVPVARGGKHHLVDGSGGSVAIGGGPGAWITLAISGGHPIDAVVRWSPQTVELLAIRDGDRLIPVGSEWMD